MDTDNQDKSAPSSPDLRQQIDANAKRLGEIYESVEKTRKYFLITMIANLVLFVLPLVIALFVLPPILKQYLGQLQSLGL